MNLLIWAAFASALTTTADSLAATTAASGALAPGCSINSVNVPPGTTWATFSGGSGTLALPTVTYPASNLSVSGPNVTLPPGSNVNALLGATVTTASSAGGVTLPAGTTVAAIIQADVAPSLNNPGGTPGIIQLSANPTAVPVNIGGYSPLQFALTANAITATGADANATYTGAPIVFNATISLERSFDGGNTWITCNQGNALAIWNAGTPVSLTFGEPEKNVLYRLNATAYGATSGVTINYRISQTGGAAESLAVGPLSGG